jgi:hypothetical protein
MGKNLILVSLILWFGIAVSGCKKDENLELPQITTIGANTIGFKLNGQVNATNSLGSISGSNCLLGDSLYFELFANCTNASISLFVGTNAKVGTYIFSTHPHDARRTILFGQNWGIIFIAPPHDVIGNDVYDYYITEPEHPGSITILRNDSTGIISGTFEFTAINPLRNDTVNITEGRFDIDVAKLNEWEKSHRKII